MSVEDTVWVKTEHNRYPVWVGTDLLNQTGDLIRHVATDAERVLLVTNDVVYDLYGRLVQESLTSSGFRTSVAVVPDGEKAKSLAWAEKLYDTAVNCGIDRSSLVVALGGGVVGDLAGFVAATYMRGLGFVQMPTTLLAQVDSSIGGKVAVNHPLGKNLIGAFHQPQAVICDLDTLSTLPERQLRNGLAEVIKHGIIGDPALLEHMKAAANWRDLSFLRTCVACSLRFKAEIVAEDENEKGIRTVLNFGHTIGHAIEQVVGFGRYTHGEAVALGMVGALHISAEMGLLSADERDAIVALLKKYGYPMRASRCSIEELLAAMRRDKKSRNGRIRFVLLERIGSPVLVDTVPVQVIQDALGFLTSPMEDSEQECGY